MKKLMILTMFAVFALAVADASAQESKAIFKGTAKNSSGMKFSEWDLTLVKDKPLTIRQKIDVMEGHTFNFKAQAGRKMSVKVVSKEPSTAFVVYADKEEPEQIGGSTEENMNWEGAFDAAGDYKIVLSADGKSNYTITITIN